MATQIAAARSRDRYWYKHDMAKAASLGITIHTLTRTELRDNLARIDKLAANTRRLRRQDIPRHAASSSPAACRSRNPATSTPSTLAPPRLHPLSKPMLITARDSYR